MTQPLLLREVKSLLVIRWLETGIVGVWDMTIQTKSGRWGRLIVIHEEIENLQVRWGRLIVIHEEIKNLQVLGRNLQSLRLR